MTAAATRIRVLVVDSDASLRQGLARLLGQHPLIEVVGSALSGRTAIPKVASYRPDCVVLNLATNGEEGLELLGHLRACPETKSLAVANELVAGDVVQRASQGSGTEVVHVAGTASGDQAVSQVAHEVLPALLRIARPNPDRHAAAMGATAGQGGTVVEAAPRPLLPTSCPARFAPAPRGVRVVGIGVSTGGPKALAELLPQLPAGFPLPILLVQHMPPKFTASLAESLNRSCKVRVREAVDGERPAPGVVLIAPGGLHMKVVRGDTGDVVKLTQDPPECSCRPSVDYLFRSLAEAYDGRVLAIVLTGMGEDGWRGSRDIHDRGGRVLAQNEATCTVYGMPRGPVEAGIATAVPLAQMADAVVQIAKGTPCS